MVKMMKPDEYFENIKKPENATMPLQEQKKDDTNMYMALALLLLLAVVLWE